MTWQSDIDDELKKRLGNKYVAPTVAKSAGLNKEEIDKEIKQRMESIKAKPSQIAREEQQTKTEEQKPSFIQKVKTGITKIGEAISGKKKIEQQVQQTKEQTQQDQTLLQKVSTAQINQQKLKQNILDDQINRMKSFDSVTSADLTPGAKKKVEEITQPIFTEVERLGEKAKTTETKDWRDRVYEMTTTGKDVPFIGDVVEIPETIELLKAAERLKNNKATQQDAVLLNDWLQQQNRDSTFGYKVLDVVIGSAKMGAELYATAGIYTAGKEATKKGVKYLMSKAGKEAIEDLVKKKGVKAIATKVGYGLAGEAVRTAALAPLKLPQDVLERQLVSKMETISGITKEEEGIGKSITKGYLDLFTEYASERGGDALGMISKLDSPVKDKLMKTAIYQTLVKLNPGKESAITKILTRAGYDGIVSEMLEERMGEVFRGMLFEVGLSDQEFKLPTMEQLAIEAVSFAIPGTISKTSDFVKTKLSDVTINTIQLTPDAAIETVQMSDLKGTDAGNTIIAAAYKAKEEGNMVLVDLDSKTGAIVLTPKQNQVGVSISEEKIEPQAEKETTTGTTTSLEALEQTKNELFSVYDGFRGQHYTISGNLNKVEGEDLKVGDGFSIDNTFGNTQGKHEGIIDNLEFNENMEGGKSVLIDYTDPFGNKKTANIVLKDVDDESYKPEFYKITPYSEKKTGTETSPEALQQKKEELMKKVSVGKQGETIKTEETTKKLTNEEITQLKELAKASNTAKSFLDKIGPVNAEKIKSSGNSIIGFYNNSIKETKEKPLIEEAKKYKSADEFIKAQKKLFRGGSKLDLTKVTNEGISFAKDVNTANRFNQGLFGTGEGIRGYIVDKNAKIININNIPVELQKKFETDETALTKYVLDRGFDGVDIGDKFGENEVRIFNPDIIKKEYSNISELKDIFDKSKEKITEPKQPEAKKEQPKPTIDKEQKSETERQAEEYLNKRSIKFRTDIKTSDELGVKGKTKQEIKELIVQHNLSEESLLYANKMGGLAVPSIAISAKETPLESFGEITLLGNKELITPSPTSKVYGADIYSPRYPRITYTPNKNAISYLRDKINEAAKKYSKEELLNEYTYIEYFKENGRQGIADSRTTQELFYIENNKDIPKDRYELQDKAYEYKEYNNYEYQNYVNEIIKNISGTEEIFMGFTYSGNRKYKPHTLENVVNIMKKELVDTEGFNYGVGNIRANLAKRFKSIKEIQANRNVIVSKDEMDEFKSYIEDKFDKIVEKAIDVYTGQATYPNDTFTQIIRDGIKNNDLQQELNEYGFEKVDYKELSDFLTELKQAPTEYFEAKLKRAVDLGEFEAAIVPDNVSKETLNILESKGIDVYKYSNEENRSDIVKFVAEKRKIAFRLADDFEKSTGIKLSNDQEQKIIELNKQIFGDEDIRITAQILTPDGQKALGSYRDRMIDILDGQANAVDTYYHEAVHKYFDLFTTKEEQIKLLVEAKNTFNTKDFAEAEEMLAENFINYVKTRETKLEKSKGIFEKIISRIKQFFDNETTINKFYEEIIQGKAKTKKTTSEKVNTAKNITQIKSALKSVKNKIDNILSDVEGRATVAQELRSGLNTKDIAALKLAWSRNQKFQEGDLETIRNSNYFELVNRVVEDVQIKYPEKSDDEAYEFALNLPTKAEEKGIKPEELKQLIKRQKTLSSYLDTLKRKQTQITGEEEIKRGDEIYKEWTSVLESQEKLNKLITSQQRIEAAQRPVEEGTGKPKLSKVAQRVLDKLVDVKDYDVTYQPMNIVEDAAKAAEFVDQNPELSLKIAKGLELPPPDITETAISIAAAQKALDNKDYLLYTRLILSRTFRQTRRGQEIVAERGRQDENSTEFFMKKLLEERARLVTKGKTWLFEKEKSVQKIIAKEVQKVKTDMDKKVLRKLESAQKLIDSLTCKI